MRAEPRSNRRLIVVSNRVMRGSAANAGGMAPALYRLLQSRGGTWLGWSGAISDDDALQQETDGALQRLTWDLSQTDFDQFYRDFSNRALWPLLHGRTDLLSYRRTALQGYLRVNQRFADRVAAVAGAEDLVWVHDYHLLPLGQRLREAGLRARIGFFLHTPLPPHYVLGTLPQHRDLFGSLVAYDLIGVQTARDAEALSAYLCEACGARRCGDGVMTPDGRQVAIRAFPIGVDPDVLARLSASSELLRHTRRLRDSLGRRKLLIGVDRLDYSKGLPQRIKAFGQLLDRHPEFAGTATYLQITPKSREQVSEYRSLGREVQRLVGDINGRHADPDWTPVRYLNSGYSHAVLAGFYRQARVCLVTPLRDGMNLVAKEFIACQPEDDPGVLLLSEFAGAAAELADVALIVNPNDIEDCAAKIATALEMPLAERQRRWQAGMAILRANDVHRWGASFLSMLERATPDASESVEPAPSIAATRRPGVEWSAVPTVRAAR